MFKFALALMTGLSISSAAMASDLAKCGNRYLASVPSESQAEAQALLDQAVQDGTLVVALHLPKAGIYALEPASSDKAEATLEVMETLNTLQGVVVECDTPVTIQ